MTEPYLPTGYIVYQGTDRDDGTIIPIAFFFVGITEMLAVKEFAQRKGLTGFNKISPTMNLIPTAPNASSPQSCPIHGSGAWIKPNKFKGSHKFYCAYKLDNGGYCGQKI